MQFLSPSLRATQLTTLALTAASTLLLPFVRGYGTDLFQLVGLGAFALVEHFTSAGFPDRHRAITWTVALLLNVSLFSLPLVAIWLSCRRRWQAAGSIITATWFAFYVACLFFLFPATDGP
jgi:hypothetical protein